MYILAFDTTAASCSVCLFRDHTEVSKTYQRMEFGQAEFLLPEIKRILDSVKIGVEDLGLVVVCVGPGSFTGVRSSISAARAFGIANRELPIVGVSAFEAYLNRLTADEVAEVNAVIIETKRDDFYFELFDKNKNKINEPTTGYKDEIINMLKNKKVSVIGDGVERFLSSPTGLNFHSIKMEFYPPVDSIAMCGLNKLKSGKKDFPKPLYLRAPDVCVF